MENSDARIELLRALRIGHDEILNLRRRVAEMEPTFEMVALLRRVIEGPQRGGVMAEDAAWLLNRESEKIIESRKEKATP